MSLFHGEGEGGAVVWQLTGLFRGDRRIGADNGLRLWRMIIGLTVAVTTHSARAADFSDGMPCSAVAATLDHGNQETRRSFILYVEGTIEKIDVAHTDRGEPGIVNKLSDGGFLDLVAVVSVHCREFPKLNVYNSAAYVYRATRELELSLRTAK